MKVQMIVNQVKIDDLPESEQAKHRIVNPDANWVTTIVEVDLDDLPSPTWLESIEEYMRNRYDSD